MNTDVPRVTVDEIRTRQRGMMGNLLDLRRQEAIAPGMEETSVIEKAVPGRITAGYGTFRDVADRFSGVTPYTITVPYDKDVRPGDRWVDEEGRVFNVLDVRTTGTWHTATVTLCDWIH